jgi:hypothetical protein
MQEATHSTRPELGLVVLSPSAHLLKNTCLRGEQQNQVWYEKLLVYVVKRKTEDGRRKTEDGRRRTEDRRRKNWMIPNVLVCFDSLEPEFDPAGPAPSPKPQAPSPKPQSPLSLVHSAQFVVRVLGCPEPHVGGEMLATNKKDVVATHIARHLLSKWPKRG